MPKGWTVKTSVIIPKGKVAGAVVRISNTTLVHNGQELKVNVAECQSDEDAAKVHALFLGVHKNAREWCPRDGRTVVEFVGGDVRLLERAYQELAVKPPKVIYDVAFEAAPLEKCDPMEWNKLFNACLVPKRDEVRIGQLAKAFAFGEQIHLRTHGLGGTKLTYAFDPAPRQSKVEADGEVESHAFPKLPRKHGLPVVGVKLTVLVEAYALTPTKRKAGKELLGPTEFWPSEDPKIVELAKQITQGKTSVRDKTDAILAWFGPGKNFKYAGAMGSRYGVKKALDQGFGRCWDFSDCFVTLCRAAGVPSRQVMGWLPNEGGHLWAEVLLEGEGWRQVDPTAGLGCDLRYVPYVASEDGRVPLVYVSAVTVQPRR